MSGSSVGLILQDTDHGNNDADDCYYNTCDSDSKLYCQIYYVPFIVFSICTTSVNTGSSQNVLILAKGEPLPVLVTPCHYYNIFVLFLSKRIFDSNIKLLFLLTSISFRFLQDINVLLLIDSIVDVNTIFSIAVPPKA